MRVYRFRDSVAVTPDDGPTFYIDPENASILAEAMRLVATDIQSVRFTDSDVGTIEIETSEESR